MPNPTEVAELFVGGQKYRDWKHVTVELRWAEPFSLFTLTCAERSTVPKAWPELAIKPGDVCDIYLGGQLAITGFVTSRQSSYDANDHGVQIIGKSKTWDAARSSIHPKDTNFDGYSWVAIARKLLGQVGVKLEVVGTIDETPFENCHAHPGELCWQFLETIARDRKIHLGNDEKGNAVAIGDHQTPVIDSIIEGKNLIRGSVIIHDEFIFEKYFAVGQRSGNDKVNGQQSSEILAEAPGTSKRSSISVTPVEMPGTPREIQQRAEFEQLLHEGAKIDASLTVQGWLRQNGDLWRCGETIYCKCPMHLLDRPLSIKTAIFTQGPEGTFTTLELVLPWLLNGVESYSNLPAADKPKPGQVDP